MLSFTVRKLKDLIMTCSFLFPCFSCVHFMAMSLYNARFRPPMKHGCKQEFQSQAD